MTPAEQIAAVQVALSFYKAGVPLTPQLRKALEKAIDPNTKLDG